MLDSRKYEAKNIIAAIGLLHADHVISFLRGHELTLRRLVSVAEISDVLLAIIRKLQYGHDYSPIDLIRLFGPAVSDKFSFPQLQDLLQKIQCIYNGTNNANQSTWILDILKALKKCVTNASQLVQVLPFLEDRYRLMATKVMDEYWDLLYKEECRIAFLNGRKDVDATTYTFFNAGLDNFMVTKIFKEAGLLDSNKEMLERRKQRSGLG